MMAYLEGDDNGFLQRKTSLIIKQLPALFLSEEFYERCLQHSGKSVRYLFSSVSGINKDFDKAYQLVIPAWMRGVLSQVLNAMYDYT